MNCILFISAAFGGLKLMVLKKMIIWLQKQDADRHQASLIFVVDVKVGDSRRA